MKRVNINAFMDDIDNCRKFELVSEDYRPAWSYEPYDDRAWKTLRGALKWAAANGYQVVNVQYELDARF